MTTTHRLDLPDEARQALASSTSGPVGRVRWALCRVEPGTYRLLTVRTCDAATIQEARAAFTPYPSAWFVTSWMALHVTGALPTGGEA